jgi:hypothetical protein
MLQARNMDGPTYIMNAQAYARLQSEVTASRRALALIESKARTGAAFTSDDRARLAFGDIAITAAAARPVRLRAVS